MPKSKKISEAPFSPGDVRRQRFVEGMVVGKSMRQSALDAGYSESMANSATANIMPACREAFRLALGHKISVEKLSQTIADGLGAEETKFFADKGVVMDQRNVTAWSERRQYSELASRLMGLEPPKEVTGADGGPLEFLLVTEHVGRTR